MCTLRDVVVFCAGAEFLHTISHMALPMLISLPLDMGFFVLTPVMNYWVIGINALITAGLLWWAHKLNKK